MEINRKTPTLQSSGLRASDCLAEAEQLVFSGFRLVFRFCEALLGKVLVGSVIPKASIEAGAIASEELFALLHVLLVRGNGFGD